VSSSARRALKVLDAVGAAEAPLGVTEIGRRLDLPAGTVFRSLDALERGGYVARYQASSRYTLGSTVTRLRQSLFAGFHIREVCLPYLRQLAFASGETTSLTVPVGWYAVRIAAAPGTNEVTNSPPLGAVLPLSQGIAAKAMLAFLPPAAMARFRNWARGHAVKVPGEAALGPELSGIRERGCVVEQTAFASGRAALALPIRGPERAIAAIAVEGPALDLAKPGYHDDLPRWIEIVHAIEALVRARPALFGNPFDPLDPDTIVLRAAA
jgi:DNA-binding IclR family transcriptional regulator